MTRATERLIDLAALALMLTFCWLFRSSQPALAGFVMYAAVQFWLHKNADSPDSAAHQEIAAQAERAAEIAAATAKAAAAVLETAATVRTKPAAEPKGRPKR